MPISSNSIPPPPRPLIDELTERDEPVNYKGKVVKEVRVKSVLDWRDAVGQGEEIWAMKEKWKKHVLGERRDVEGDGRGEFTEVVFVLY